MGKLYNSPAYEAELAKVREAIRRKPVQGCMTEEQATPLPLPTLDGVSDDGWRELRDSRRDDVDSREEAERFRRGW